MNGYPLTLAHNRPHVFIPMQRLPLIFALLLFFSVQLVNGQSIGKESLSHLNGVAVTANVSQDAEEEGLPESTIETNTELQLRKANIKVYTKNERDEQQSSPTLRVSVHTYKRETGLFAYSVQVECDQVIFTIDGTSTLGITYQTSGTMGIVGADKIRDVADVVRDEVRIFINDWLSVHQE